MEFKQLDITDLAEIQPFLERHPFRSCDFTVGGLFLWAKAFDYKWCIEAETLYISGHAVNDNKVEAYSIPLGSLPLEESLQPLNVYCKESGKPLILSSVPEEALSVLIDMGARHVEQLSDWSDYLYDAEALATLAGKKLSKKRNHVHRFESDHPDAVFRPITAADSGILKAFYEKIAGESEVDSEMAAYDRGMTFELLDNIDSYPFVGCMLTTEENGVVGFTFGEVLNDTLHVHVEKMNHEIPGAGETLCNRFVRHMTCKYPQIKLVNRQDDSGDMGLRRAKLSLHPLFLLHKYNVEF